MGRLARLTETLGDRVQLVGDDLFVTNVELPPPRDRRGRRERDPREGEPDRDAERVARRRSSSRERAGYATVISHRSGETEDTTIADLAVAVNAGPDQDRGSVTDAIASRSTTSCCASRRSSATMRCIRAGTPSAEHRWLIGNSSPRGWWLRRIAGWRRPHSPVFSIRARAGGVPGSVAPIPASTRHHRSTI